MFAMELNGAHVGRKIKLEWFKKKAAQAGRSKGLNTNIVTITKLIHWPNGDVTLQLGRWDNMDTRYPPDAIVTFVG